MRPNSATSAWTIPAGNTAADTAEAGSSQVSYNSVNAHFLLGALFDQYSSTDFADIFGDGVACSSASLQNWAPRTALISKRSPKRARHSPLDTPH